MIEYLPWDSDFFQLRIGRLMLDKVVRPDLTGLEQYDLLYLMLAPDRLPPEELSSNSVKYDTKVTWKKKLSDVCLDLHPNIREIRVPSPEFLTLGYQSGWCSRFFLDPRLKKYACDMYRIWLEKYLADSSAATYVYMVDGKMAGMINCKVQDGEGCIGLFAVDNEFRGRGIGAALAQAVEYFFHSRNVLKCQVVTQKDNIGAMRAYQRYGYRIDYQVDIWHWWNK